MGKLTGAQEDARKYIVIIEGIEAEVAKFEEEVRWSHRRIGPAQDRGHYARVSADMGYLARERRDKLQAVVDAHRSYLPYVESGLMTVAQAVHEVGVGNTANAIREAGDRIAAPAHVRIMRERNAEVNAENDVREFIGGMIGQKLVPVTKPRNG